MHGEARGRRRGRDAGGARETEQRRGEERERIERGHGRVSRAGYMSARGEEVEMRRS